MREKHAAPNQNVKAPPQRNLIGRRVAELRKFGSGERKHKLEQAELAGKIEDAILAVAPRGAPVHARQRFTRSDLAKIEGGSRYVRDYELVAIARALDVSVGELLGSEAAPFEQLGGAHS